MEKQDFSSTGIQQAYRVAYLIAGHLRQALTEAERLELTRWLEESEHNRTLFAELTDAKNLQGMNVPNNGF